MLLWLIWTRTPQVPTHDEWATVSIVQRFDEGKLDFNNLWAFHAQHRILIPRIINLAVIELTGWNRQIEMTFNLLIVFFTALLIFLCLRSTFRSHPATSLLSIPISLLIFSPAQYENWLQPFQIAFFASIFGYVLSAWAITSSQLTWRRLFIAIFGGIVASFSLSAGLLSWVMLLPILYIVSRSKSKCLVWGLTGLSIIIPYMIGFPIPQAAGSQTISVANPVRFTLVLLGVPIGYPSVSLSEQTAIVSILLVAINFLVLFLLVRPGRSVWIWISLMGFAFAFAVICGLSRAMLGYDQAMMSRYQSFAALWWLSILVISVYSVAELAGRWFTNRTARVALQYGLSLLNVVAILALLAGLLRNNVVGFASAMTWMNLQRENQDCVVYYDVCPENIAQWFYGGNVAVFRQLSAYLEARQLAVFKISNRVTATNLSLRKDQTNFNVEVVGGSMIDPSKPARITASRKTPLTIGGWAVDSSVSRAANGVFISIDGSIDVPTIYGISRPDVGAYFKNEAYVRSGFYTAVPLAQLSPGKHYLSIKILSADRTSYFAPDWKLEILLD